MSHIVRFAQTLKIRRSRMLATMLWSWRFVYPFGLVPSWVCCEGFFFWHKKVHKISSFVSENKCKKVPKIKDMFKFFFPCHLFAFFMITTANLFFLGWHTMKSRFQPRRQLPTGEVSLSSTAFFRHRKSCAPRSKPEVFRGDPTSTELWEDKNDRIFKQNSCLNEDNMAFWKKQDRCNNCKQIAVGKQRARSKNETVWEAYIEDWRISLTF